VNDEKRARNLDAVHRAFAGIGASDVDQMLANYTDDLVLELPYGDPPTVLEGRPAVHAYLTQAFKIVKFRLDITEVHDTIDDDKVVLEYVSDGRIETTGKPYANRYIGVYWFRDGRICRVREFYNPMPFLAGITPDDAGSSSTSR
jgi:ketosteroid isomerase-like protein